LSLLIFRFAKIYLSKRFQWPLKKIFDQQPANILLHFFFFVNLHRNNGDLIASFVLKRNSPGNYFPSYLYFCFCKIKKC